MNKGELIPDELVVEIATDRLKKDDCKDGFPSGWIPSDCISGRKAG